MRFRLFQPSPQTSPRAICPPVIWLTPVPNRWTAPADSPDGVSRDELLWNKSFLQSWFEDDAVVSESGEGARINWGAISGMVLAFAISAIFWTGVGLIIERIWK